MNYDLLRGLHILAVIAWMAGMFYLPRLFVYHTMLRPGSAESERFKAQAYVLGRQLRSDGVRVQVFRQIYRGGQWVDQPASSATNSEMEDRVLARARELRSQTSAAR
jgi:hypothetical protein